MNWWHTCTCTTSSNPPEDRQNHTVRNVKNYRHYWLHVFSEQHFFQEENIIHGVAHKPYLYFLTPSLRRPRIHANFFPTTCRTACKHAFRFLRVFPEAVSTRHSWLWQTLDDVYTRRCFAESEWTRFGAPDKRHCRQWMSSLFCGFLPNPFIHDLFCWSSRHKFVKTDL